ncbi:hypothetical protein [Spirosoma endophyticum]|uniref:hypothetical protein n=1 Tax=Spirosoma endophyticum TaxID=662367 RepID=UPI0011606427|nr:hypothetical protein [Spirosoma endophyticum]
MKTNSGVQWINSLAELTRSIGQLPDSLLIGLQMDSGVRLTKKTASQRRKPIHLSLLYQYPTWC